jgi:hypothetical protein
LRQCQLCDHGIYLKHSVLKYFSLLFYCLPYFPPCLTRRKTLVPVPLGKVKAEDKTAEYETAEYGFSEYETAEYEFVEYETAEYEFAEYETAEYDFAEYKIAEYDFAEYETAE